MVAIKEVIDKYYQIKTEVFNKCIAYICRELLSVEEKEIELRKIFYLKDTSIVLSIFLNKHNKILLNTDNGIVSIDKLSVEEVCEIVNTLNNNI